MTDGPIEVISSPGTSPSLAVGADGGFLVVWEASGHMEEGIHGRLFMPDLQPAASAFRIDPLEPGGREPSVAAISGGYVVLWVESSETGWLQVRAQRLTWAGAKAGAPFVVDEGLSDGSVGLFRPVAEGRPDGSFVVAWYRDDPEMAGVEVRLFAPDGTPLGEAVPTGLWGYCHSVSVDAAGGFVVAGAVETVFARGFESGGQPLAPPFQVSPTGDGRGDLVDLFYCPTVDHRANGGFSITWSWTHVDLTGGGSADDSWTLRQLRSFDPAGHPGVIHEAGGAWGGWDGFSGKEATLDASGQALLAFGFCEESGGEACGRLYSLTGSPLSRSVQPWTEAIGAREMDLELTPEGDALAVAGFSGAGPGVRLYRFGISGDIVPRASFLWSPAEPVAGEEVTFLDHSAGAPTSWSWDFGGDGTEDSDARNPLHTFTEPGPIPVTLEVTTPYGSDRITREVLVAPADDLPYVTAVERQYRGAFLPGSTLTNRFDVEVDWQGTPGTVAFSVNGGPETVETGSAEGASHVLDMGGDFSPSLAPSIVTITPTNDEGVEGASHQEPVYVFPLPQWLQAALSVAGAIEEAAPLGDEARWEITVKYPNPPKEAIVDVPTWVPIFGGPLGLTETFYEVDGSVRSGGEGGIRLAGQTGFVSGEKSVAGKVEGSGTFNLLRPGGLDLTSASATVTVSIKVAKAYSLRKLPGIDKVGKVPVVGGKVRSLAEVAEVRGEIKPALSAQVTFRQKGEELVFDGGSGGLHLDLKAVLEIQTPDKSLSIQGWIGGGGKVTIGYPAPYLQHFGGHVEVGGGFKLDALFEIEENIAIRATCKWTPATGVECFEDSAEETAGLVARNAPVTVSSLGHDFGRFGDYARMPAPEREAGVATAPKAAAREEVLVENVFAGASPQVVETPAGTLLLWEHQDLDDPVLQSNEIAWSFDDGLDWTPPALVADDTRSELSPVAAVDDQGRVVAAWLRIADPAFDDPITEAADLPLFYRELEVVTATFDPSTQTWSSPVPLTSDASLDTNLQLVSDGAGNLLLTWLSNPDAELTSTAESPSALLFSVWDAGTASWSAPAVIASGLAGVGSHASSIQGPAEATILVPRDPDPAVEGDDLLDLYTWNGTTWNGPSVFAPSSATDRAPVIAYDGTDTHVVWLRGDDLVHATLADPSPTVVRQGATSLSLHEKELLAGPAGDLALVWQEVASNGPASLVVRFYDPVEDLWSEDRQLLVEEEVLHREVDTAYDGGTLRLAFLSTLIDRVEEERTVGGETVTFTNLPQDGRTDLRYVEQPLGRNLAVTAEDLIVEPPSRAAGDSATASLQVHNQGERVVTGFSIDLRLAAPDDTGTLLGSATHAEPLVPGDSAVLDVVFTEPADPGDLFAVVDPLDEVEESDETDNVAVDPRANEPPTPVIVATPTEGPAPLAVELDAEHSFDAEDNELTYRWTFADGSPTAEGKTVSHMFSIPGIYPVTLSARDADGAVGSTSVLITAQGAGCPGETDLVLTRQVVDSKRVFEACSTITAGDDFRIEPSGDVSLRAGERVVLGDGFAVGPGANLRVTVDPELDR